MVLAIDSQESGGTGHHSTTSPLTWSFTNTAGNLVVVGIIATNTGTTAPTLGTVSYGGNAMTLVSGSSNTKVSSNATRIALFSLSSPLTGANTVSVAATFPGASPDIIAGAISFSGASATPGTAASAQDASPGATASVTLNGTTNGSIVVSLVSTGTSVGSATSPTTLSWRLNVGVNTNGDNGALGQQSTTGGSVTASYAVTSDHWIVDAVEIFAGGISVDQMAAAARMVGQITPIWLKPDIIGT